MALRCSGVTRKGAQCSITSCSRLTDERGRLVADPLRLGGTFCRFHARPFVTQCVEHFDGPAVVFFLDLETTGVDVASDQIIEIACIHAPSDPRAKGAAFSSVVRAAAEDTAFHVHGISAHEIALAPSLSLVWRRFVEFVGNIQVTYLQDSSDSESDQDERLTALPSELPAMLLAAHNGLRFDFAMILFELVRHGISWAPLEQWFFVDTLALVQAVGVSHLGGCSKLQCLVQGQCVGPLRAHRALDDCVCLRTVVERVAESYGVSAADLLRPLVSRLDVAASATQISNL